MRLTELPHVLSGSGAIDISEPHYAKAIAFAAVRESAYLNRPITPKGKQDAKNLEYF